MTAGHAGYDTSRLPWLNDTAAPVVAPKGKASPLRYFLGGVGAALLLAGTSYWLGLRSMLEQPESASEVSMSLPGPTEAAPQGQAEAEPAASEAPAMPRVILVPQPAPVLIREAVPVPMPKPDSQGAATNADAASTPEGADATSVESAVADADQTLDEAAPAKPAPLRLWPADVSEGASGRAVRIGTYATRLQAKKAWAKLVRVYPGMGRLKAVVAPVPSVRNGKTYYRLQFGTTSQAHSAVLCQRMRIVGQSCVVIGAPQSGAAAS